MHEAGTNHSKYALPVYMQHDQDSSDFLPPLSRTTVRNLLEEYEDALASGSPLAIAIDEVSMLDAITFGRILKRVEEFESDYFETTPPRLFILVGNFCFMSDLLYTVHLIHFFVFTGDFFQIPPCRSTPLYSTVLDNALFKKPSYPGGPEDYGQRFFSEFQLFRLDKQYRSIDEVHSGNLSSLRSLNPAVYPFTKALLAQYKFLQAADVIADPEWLIAPVVCLFNQERHALNVEALKVFSKAAGFPIISWRNALHGTSASLLTAAESNLLFGTHPALSGFFVPGCPAYGRVNHNTSLGLYNGSKMILHSLTLDKIEDRLALNNKIRSALPGDVVVLQHPPYSVQVELVKSQSDTFSSEDSLVPGSFVVPLMVDKKSNHEVVRQWELLQRNGKTISSIKYRSHPYDIGFAITYEKTQSKSFKRLILDLQQWPKMSLTAEKVLVGLSRVETLEHLRILPYGPSQNLNHLYYLKPNELMLHWMAGFNESGFWSVQGSAQSIQKHPLTSKNSGKTTSAATPGKTSTKKTTKHAETSTGPTTNSVQVVSQFRLNLAHALRANTDKLFHSFFVEGDGHCLFRSFIQYLKITTPISELRRQTVDYIASDPSPINRLNALNAHILRFVNLSMSLFHLAIMTFQVSF